MHTICVALAIRVQELSQRQVPEPAPAILFLARLDLDHYVAKLARQVFIRPALKRRHVPRRARPHHRLALEKKEEAKKKEKEKEKEKERKRKKGKKRRKEGRKKGRKKERKKRTKKERKNAK